MTTFARGAATTVAATSLVANGHTSGAVPLRPAEDTRQTNFEDAGASAVGELTEAHRLIWTVEDIPDEWDKKHEQEFRKLALLEAKGELTAEQSYRLDQLNRWRDTLLCAPSSDEMLLQLRRDSLLSRMENLLREYVKFEEATNKQRSTP